MLQLAEDKKQKIFDKSLGAIKHWLERFDTIIIGPGLGRDEMVHHVVIKVSLQSNCIFCAGRFGLFLLACLIQAYIAALTFAVSAFCCLSMVLVILLPIFCGSKSPQAAGRKLETNSSEYSIMQLHVVC